MDLRSCIYFSTYFTGNFPILLDGPEVMNILLYYFFKNLFVFSWMDPRSFIYFKWYHIFFNFRFKHLYFIMFYYLYLLRNINFKTSWAKSLIWGFSKSRQCKLRWCQYWIIHLYFKRNYIKWHNVCSCKRRSVFVRYWRRSFCSRKKRWVFIDTVL